MRKLIPLCLLFLVSCEFKMTTGDDVTSSSFSVRGNCHLVQIGQDAICLEYDSTFSQTQVDNDCDTQNTNYNAHNITTHFSSYLPLVDCRAGGRIGLCSFPHYRIIYFSNEWTSTVAESNCISLSGTYKDL